MSRRKCKGCGCRLAGVWVTTTRGLNFCGELCRDLHRARFDPGGEDGDAAVTAVWTRHDSLRDVGADYKDNPVYDNAGAPRG